MKKLEDKTDVIDNKNILTGKGISIEDQLTQTLHRLKTT